MYDYSAMCNFESIIFVLSFVIVVTLETRDLITLTVE